jgi:hypothetical protein
LNSTSIHEAERSIDERALRARGSVLAFLFLAAAALAIPLTAILLFLL